MIKPFQFYRLTNSLALKRLKYHAMLNRMNLLTL